MQKCTKSNKNMAQTLVLDSSQSHALGVNSIEQIVEGVHGIGKVWYLDDKG